MKKKTLNGKLCEEFRKTELSFLVLNKSQNTPMLTGIIFPSFVAVNVSRKTRKCFAKVRSRFIYTRFYFVLVWFLFCFVFRIEIFRIPRISCLNGKVIKYKRSLYTDSSKVTESRLSFLHCNSMAAMTQ